MGALPGAPIGALLAPPKYRLLGAGVGGALGALGGGLLLGKATDNATKKLIQRRFGSSMLSAIEGGGVEKAAFTAPNHTKLMEETWKAMGGGKPSKEVRALVLEGNHDTDAGIRHPWIPTNARLHAMPIATKEKLLKELAGDKVVAVKDIARAAADPESRLAGIRAVRGLKNLGQAQHSLMDVAPHFEQPSRRQLKNLPRVSEYLRAGGEDSTILGWASSGAAHAEQGLKRAAGFVGRTTGVSKLDDLNKNTRTGRDSIRRAQEFGMVLRKEVVQEMVTEHGLGRREAGSKYRTFMSGTAPKGVTKMLGNLSRNVNFIGDQISRPFRREK